MKKLIILFILIANLTLSNTINLNSINYDKYVFNSKDRVYSIIYGHATPSSHKYYLYYTDKETGKTSRVFTDAQYLQVLSSYLVSKEAYPIEIYPKEFKNDNSKN